MFFDEFTFDHGRLFVIPSKEARVINIPQEPCLVVIFSNDPVVTAEILLDYSISPSEDLEEGHIPSESLHSHDGGFYQQYYGLFPLVPI